MERCRSGRTGATGNRVGVQASRGFESRPLRHYDIPNSEYTDGFTQALSCCRFNPAIMFWTAMYIVFLLVEIAELPM